MLEMFGSGSPILSLWLEATLILAAAALIDLVLRRAPAAARSAVWSAALTSLLVLPAVSLLGLVWEPELPALASTWTSASPASILASALPADAVSSTATSPADPWLVAWLAGCLFFGLRLLRAHLVVRSWERSSMLVDDGSWLQLLAEETRCLGLRRPVPLLRSECSAMPLASGLWRPWILLPAVADSWTEKRRRLVLRHELAHVERRDGLVQAVVQLACCLYWLNPLVWWAARRYEQTRELACDDRVLALGAAPADYAGHLLAIARASRGALPAAGVAMARPSQLEGRLVAIFDPRQRRHAPGIVWLLAAAVFTASVLVAVVRPAVAGDPPPASKPAPLRTLMKNLSDVRAQDAADVLRETGALGRGGTVQIDESTNSLILRVPPERVDRILAALAEVDKGASRPSGLRTVMKQLSNVYARDVATAIRAAGVLGGGTVQVDERTNTLILRILPEQIDEILAVVDEIDRE